MDGKLVILRYLENKRTPVLLLRGEVTKGKQTSEQMNLTLADSSSDKNSFRGKDNIVFDNQDIIDVTDI